MSQLSTSPPGLPWTHVFNILKQVFVYLAPQAKILNMLSPKIFIIK